MAVTAYYYAKFFLSATNAEIDLAADDIRVALTTSSYTPNQDTHDYFDDITNEVANGNGYTSGGELLAAKTVGTTLNVFTFDNTADTVWTSSTFTAARAVVYKDTGTPATSPLICWIDFDGDKSPSSGSLTISWATAGICNVTVADATGFPA